MTGNGQHRPVYTTTTTRAVAALAVRAITRNDPGARAAISEIDPSLDFDALVLQVEIVTSVLAELLNLRAIDRIYCKEPRT